MEREVVFGTDALLRFDDALQLVPGVLNGAQVVGIGLLCRKRGRARLGDDAKFIAAPDVGQRFERREAAHIRIGPASDRGSRTAPRNDDAVGAQTSERFAHGRARSGEAIRERMLRHEPVALLEVALHDAVEDLAVDAVGETGRLRSFMCAARACQVETDCKADSGANAAGAGPDTRTVVMSATRR